MICDHCCEQIPAGEEIEHYSQILCEECYMQPCHPVVHVIPGLCEALRCCHKCRKLV